MITFQGNRELLKSAKLLESNARNLYPHVSTSRIRKLIGYELKEEPKFFSKMKKEYSSERNMIRESKDYYMALIQSLQFGMFGNCAEESMLAELLGKINGQKNIYTGILGIEKEGKKCSLNHVVTFITDKSVEPNKEQFFKNKEAIIIDPWLGVTDFADNYFTKLKSIFRKTFMYEKNTRFATLPNDNFIIEIIRALSKTTKEFKENKKKLYPNIRISINPHIDRTLNGKVFERIKETNPELIIKNFKEIVLQKKEPKNYQNG